MTYEPGTILRRKEPFPEGHEYEPYNDVEVIGASPVQRNVRSEQWEGQLGDNVVIKPAKLFAGTVDHPLGELQEHYEVVSIPERVLPRIVIERPKLGPSPEEALREQAATAEVEQAKERTRERSEADA